jgi:hypothetical protein
LSDSCAGGLLKRACGTARRVWNWALNEWNKQYASGGKLNAMALKKQFKPSNFAIGVSAAS